MNAKQFAGNLANVVAYHVSENPDERCSINIDNVFFERYQKTLRSRQLRGTVEIVYFHPSEKPLEKRRLCISILGRRGDDKGVLLEEYEDNGVGGLCKGDSAYRYDRGKRKRNPTFEEDDILWSFEEANLRYSHILIQILNNLL